MLFFKHLFKTLSIVVLILFMFTACGGNTQETLLDEDTQEIYKVIVSTNTTGAYQCDGTDDHHQINLALKNVHEHGGGIVHLNQGTYTINQPIKIYSNTTLEGESMELTIIKLQSRSTVGIMTPLIVNAQLDESPYTIVEHNITLKNFSFDGNKNNNTDDTHYEGNSWHTAIAFQGVRDIIIDSVSVYNSLNDAFQFQYCHTASITHCKTSNIGHDGVYFIYSQYLHAVDNIFDLQANSGVRTDNSNHILIKNNHIYSTEGYGNVGIEIAFRNPDDTMDDLIIENNLIERAPIVGITLYANDPRYAQQAIIRNNVILQSGTGDEPLESTGINVLNFGNTIIQNNTIFNCRGSGIRFGSEWYDEVGYERSSIERNATITNNIITQNTTASEMQIYGIENLSEHLTIYADYNNVWGNKSGEYFGLSAGVHSISVDPLFVNAPYNDDSSSQFYGRAVDLHLMADSPAIDVGITIDTITTDIEGNSRPQGDGYDMGAYEYQ